ncbi:MAG: carboxylating nicotinate-nucleotide diphosphorylase, partial [Chloroflexota bacterium]
LEVALAVFRRVEPAVRALPEKADSDRVVAGDVLARVSGPIAGMLKAERTALNLLQRMSGIATATAEYVAAVQGTRARIIDTRKTAPGLRSLDKHAVAAGGGGNHRHNLGDLVLIKDNHIAALAAQGMGVRQVVELARKRARHSLRIEVEADNPEQVQEALEGGADIILLDNMPLEQMRKAVQMADGRALLEASGGITLANVAEVARAGVDLISIGALTHSVAALDISMDYE